MEKEEIPEKPWVITLHISKWKAGGEFMLTKDLGNEYQKDKLPAKIKEELLKYFEKGLMGRYLIINGAKKHELMYRFIYIDTIEYLKTMKENSPNLK
ncbi:MAG: hypothetical protein V4504_00585 [Patescibacteria group bacterium]